MSMHKEPLTPTEEAGLRAHGLKAGTPSQAADCFRQGVAWGAAAERRNLAQRLAAEAALDGFGCACTPQWVCGTCTARETIAKALAPLMRELGA